MYEETKEVRTYTLKLEFFIEASRSTIWRALTTELGSWWPDFSLMGPEGSIIKLENAPGGRMFEEWPDGGGLLWGVVAILKPEELLQMTGDLFPDWGGPAYMYRTYRLHNEDGHCRFEFEECSMGTLSESTLASLEEGWSTIFGNHLKKWCESQS